MRIAASASLAFGAIACFAGSAWGQCNWIATPLSSYSPCVGSALVMRAEVESQEATYQWRRISDGFVIATGSNPTVPVTSVDQSGQYQVVATVQGANGCTATSETFMINVRASAVVTPSAGVPYYACAGQEIVLSVQAAGPGPYSYQWYDGATAMSSSTRISGTNTPTLRIADSRTSDQGQYRCSVIHACGTVSSGIFSVAVTAVLTPPQAPTSVLLCSGNSATLNATQTSVPNGTTYQWYRGDEALANGGAYSGATTPVLSVNPVGAIDFQESFRCVLTTPCASASTPGIVIAPSGPMCGLAFQRVASALLNPVFAIAPKDDFERLFIVERSRTLRLLDLRTGVLQSGPYLTLPPHSTGGEDGFLGLAFHPRFSENGYFYAHYSDGNSDAKIVRYRANAPYMTSTTADPASATTVAIFEQNSSLHNGGWIGFRPDDTEGHLYISIGDGANSASAQDVEVHRGKILRIDIDGPDNVPGNADDADPISGAAYRSPPDNPFVGAPGQDEILAYGLRNPWRCSFDRQTGDLYIGDVGGGTEEEISLLAAEASPSTGINFGWPCLEGRFVSSTACDTLPTNATGPIFANRRNGGCAITGGFVYRGALIPHLRGYYLFSDYCGGGLFALDVTNVQQGAISEHMPFSLGARMEAQGVPVGNIPAFGEDADGEVYVMDSNAIYRVVDLGRVALDCNANGIDDALDISRGTEGDCDGDGVPNSCDSPCCPACPADFDQDGGVTGSDIAAFFTEYEQGNTCADTDADGGVTGADIAAFFTVFEAGGC